MDDRQVLLCYCVTRTVVHLLTQLPLPHLAMMMSMLTWDTVATNSY